MQMDERANEPKVSVVMSVYNAERYVAAAIESVLDNKLPKSLAKSLLYLVMNASSLNDPSIPKDTSRRRKYLYASIPYFEMNSKGSTTLPFDFDIFSPLKTHHP